MRTVLGIDYYDDMENSKNAVVSDSGSCLVLNDTNKGPSGTGARWLQYTYNSIADTVTMRVCAGRSSCPFANQTTTCNLGTGDICFQVSLARQKTAYCDTYCNRYLVACNMGQGGAPSYASRAACLADCGAITPDPFAQEDEPKYPTKECRTYHAGLAAEVNATIHCPHAAGLSVCAGASDHITRYCDIMTAVCPTEYTGFSQCQTMASAMNFTNGNPGDDFGDSFWCRQYWSLAAAGTGNSLFCPVAGKSGLGRKGGIASLPNVLQCGPDLTKPFTQIFNTVPRICKPGKVLGECCCGTGVTNITLLGWNFIHLVSPLSGGAPCLGSDVLDVPGFFIDTPTHAKAAVSVTNPPVSFEIDLVLTRGGNELKTTTSLQPACLGYGCRNLAGDCTPAPPASSTGIKFNSATALNMSPFTILALVFAAIAGKYITA
jgi:hypothetical protein